MSHMVCKEEPLSRSWCSDLLETQMRWWQGTLSEVWGPPCGRKCELTTCMPMSQEGGQPQVYLLCIARHVGLIPQLMNTAGVTLWNKKVGLLWMVHNLKLDDRLRQKGCGAESMALTKQKWFKHQCTPWSRASLRGNGRKTFGGVSWTLKPLKP